MGWVNEDDPGHEGFAVGLVEEAVTYKGDGVDVDRKLKRQFGRRQKSHIT
jgi:hypothetical protein